jgi:two-component system chemotaxis response regulator CheB
MADKIKVLIIEDSFLMRKIISEIISSDPELDVVGTAKDGPEGVEKVMTLSPDIVTLDINIPMLDGISVLEQIMRRKPTRVIMFSAYSREGASSTMKALQLGAVDFIAKPSGEISVGIDKLKEEIISKIKLAVGIDLLKYVKDTVAHAQPSVKASGSAIKKLVIIGASTGGPKAVLEVMQDIPADLSAVFLIVQHMPKGFTMSFAERIAWQSGVRAKEAEEGDVLLPGRAYVAPAGFHMTIEKERDQFKVKLNQDPPVNFVRPAVDVTMLSVADVFGKDVVAVVLTGMGKDGLEGVRKIKSAGGSVIIQDEASSVVWGMPRAIFKAGLADEVLPVAKIPTAILKYINAN